MTLFNICFLLTIKEGDTEYLPIDIYKMSVSLYVVRSPSFLGQLPDVLNEIISLVS